MENFLKIVKRAGLFNRDLRVHRIYDMQLHNSQQKYYVSEFHKVQWVCPDGIIILGMWEKYEFSQWSICDCTLLVTLCGVRDHPVITASKRLGGSRKWENLLTFSSTVCMT